MAVAVWPPAVLTMWSRVYLGYHTVAQVKVWFFLNFDYHSAERSQLTLTSTLEFLICFAEVNVES